MAVNLVELAKGYLTPDIIQKAAILRRRVRIGDAEGYERNRTDLDRRCGKSDLDDQRCRETQSYARHGQVRW